MKPPASRRCVDAARQASDVSADGADENTINDVDIVGTENHDNVQDDETTNQTRRTRTVIAGTTGRRIRGQQQKRQQQENQVDHSDSNIDSSDIGNNMNGAITNSGRSRISRRKKDTLITIQMPPIHSGDDRDDIDENTDQCVDDDSDMFPGAVHVNGPNVGQNDAITVMTSTSQSSAANNTPPPRPPLRPTSLIAATLVRDNSNRSNNNEGEAVYAETVEHDYSVRNWYLAVSCGIVAVIILITFSVAWAARNKVPIVGRDISPRCLKGLEQQTVIDHCLCYNTTEMFVLSHDEEVYLNDTVIELLIDFDVMTQQEIHDFRATHSCDARHQAMLWLSNFVRYQRNYVESEMIPAPYTIQLVLLAIFYISVGGSHDTWDIDDGWLEHHSFCSWFGVECGFVGRVEAIRLPANGLVGTIPLEIRNFQSLLTLDLSHNYGLTGGESLLNHVLDVVNLKFLTLDNIPISGSIPSKKVEQSDKYRLDTLSLSNCSLTGTLPTEIGNFPELEVFNADFNFLEGSLPSQMGNLENLFKLNLDTNFLTGTIPIELQHLSNLYFLDVQDNPGMTGTIPEFVGSMESLEVVFIAGTNVGGTIPESYCNPNNAMHFSQRVIWGDCGEQSENPMIPNCTCCDPDGFVLSWCREDLPINIAYGLN